MRGLLFAVAALCVARVNAQFAKQYSWITIPNVPGSIVQSASGVNARGEVVGAYQGEDNVWRGYYYSQKTGFRILGEGINSRFSLRITDDGTISWGIATNSYTGTLVATPGGVFTRINEDPKASIKAMQTSVNNILCGAWSPTGVYDDQSSYPAIQRIGGLPEIVSALPGFVSSVNSSGTVVGLLKYANGTQNGFIRVAGMALRMISNSGFQPRYIFDDGTVYGYDPVLGHVLWKDGAGFTKLGGIFPPFGYPLGYAPNGLMVGEYNQEIPFQRYHIPFGYALGGSAFDLDPLVINQPNTTVGAVGVSTAGHFLVRTRAHLRDVWVFAIPVPEPQTWVTSGVKGLVYLSRRRNRCC